MAKEKKTASTQPIQNEKLTMSGGDKNKENGVNDKKEKGAEKKSTVKSSDNKGNAKASASDAGRTKIRKRSIPADDRDIIALEKKDEVIEQVQEKKEPIYLEAPVKRKKKYGNSSFSAIVKTVSYIGIVLAVSVVLAVYIILVANDVFAFNKSDNAVVVELGEYPDIADVADVLHEGNVIKYPGIFKLYAKLKNKENYNFAPGTYTVYPNMNYDDLLVAFVPDKAPREQISITIPEGYSVDEIIDLFVSKGIGTRDGFIDVINNYEFDYWFLENLECSEDRIYRLEGYLYPDTYYFWSDSSEVSAISKLLSNFKKKFKKSWLERCEELGMTLDEVLILASMIQEEARYPEDYATVSSVFHNRLNSEEFEGLLQSDATVQYYYRNVYGSIKSPFTEEDMKFDCPYNTYLYKGLPPGPLSTPTIDSINSAMYPLETEYYYFVTDSEGYCMFATTYEEHKMNIALIEAGITVNDGKNEDDSSADDEDNDEEYEE